MPSSLINELVPYYVESPYNCKERLMESSMKITVSVWGNASNLGLYSKVRDILSCQDF
jgi:hypothetical protein